MFKKQGFKILVILSFLLFSAVVAYTHSGRTDSRGGHYNRKTGTHTTIITLALHGAAQPDPVAPARTEAILQLLQVLKQLVCIPTSCAVVNFRTQCTLC